MLPVVGCHGRSGASMMALAIATVVADRPEHPARLARIDRRAVAAADQAVERRGRVVRILDCAGGTRSGLLAAPTHELGPVGTGWTRARRDHHHGGGADRHRGQGGGRGIVMDRVTDAWLLPSAVPPPPLPPPAAVHVPAGGTSPAPRRPPALDAAVDAVGVVDVVDVGWEPAMVLAPEPQGSWLGRLLRTAPAVVVTVTATPHCVARLESALELFDRLGIRVVVAVVCTTAPEPTTARRVGGRAARFGALRRPDDALPPQLRDALGRWGRLLDQHGAIRLVPHDRHLATDGVTPDPLPDAVLQAAGAITDDLTPWTRQEHTP